MSEYVPASAAVVGDVVSWWHHTGCFGIVPVYGRVLRVHPKSLTIRSEQGDVRRKALTFFERGVIYGEEVRVIRWQGDPAADSAIS